MPIMRADARSPRLFALYASAMCLAIGIGARGAEARAANLVKNGDFETGSLNSWEGANGVAIDSAFPQGGGFDASFSTASSIAATLSQAVTTTPGGPYRISFYLLDQAASVFDTFNITFGGFSATITGDMAFNPTQTGDSMFATFLVPGSQITGSLTTIAFSAINDESAFDLDDVTVAKVRQDVPEPSSLTLILTALLISYGATRLGRQHRKPTCKAYHQITIGARNDERPDAQSGAVSIAH